MFRAAFSVVALVAGLTNCSTFADGLAEVNPPVEPAAGAPIALVGGRLIDGRGGQPIEDAVVIVDGAKIVAAGERATTQLPENAEVKDVSGQTILPGLIDSHLHTVNDLETPALFLAHGITSFRDPGHPFRFYQAVMQTDQTMPRAFLTGAHLDAYPPIWPQEAIIVTDEDHARQVVRQHVEHRASAIKIYFRLPLEHFTAVCETAAEHGIPVVAHLELVDADAAIKVGVKGIEHVTSFGSVIADGAVAQNFKDSVRTVPETRRELRYRMWANLDLDSQKTRELIDLIVSESVVVSPTLAVFERRAGDKGSSAVEAEAFEQMLKFVGMCHKAGATVVAGSHTSVPHAERGWAYQRELELLVEAGLTPLEALTAATLHNAQYFGTEDRLGTIERGKLADIVLVKGDPSKNINAMYDVQDVMLNGRWVETPAAE